RERRHALGQHREEHLVFDAVVLGQRGPIAPVPAGQGRELAAVAGGGDRRGQPGGVAPHGPVEDREHRRVGGTGGGPLRGGHAGDGRTGPLQPGWRGPGLRLHLAWTRATSTTSSWSPTTARPTRTPSCAPGTTATKATGCPPAPT